MKSLLGQKCVACHVCFSVDFTGGGKHEHLTTEEVVNCSCKRSEEDGLMIQCDICLCWQHGTCLGVEEEDQVRTFSKVSTLYTFHLNCRGSRRFFRQIADAVTKPYVFRLWPLDVALSLLSIFFCFSI